MGLILKPLFPEFKWWKFMVYFKLDLLSTKLTFSKTKYHYSTLVFAINLRLQSPRKSVWMQKAAFLHINAKSTLLTFFLRDKSFPKDTQCAAFLFMAPKVYTNSLWPKLGKVKSQIMFARARHDFAKFLNKQLRIMLFLTF